MSTTSTLVKWPVKWLDTEMPRQLEAAARSFFPFSKRVPSITALAAPADLCWNSSSQIKAKGSRWGTFRSANCKSRLAKLPTSLSVLNGNWFPFWMTIPRNTQQCQLQWLGCKISKKKEKKHWRQVRRYFWVPAKWVKWWFTNMDLPFSGIMSHHKTIQCGALSYGCFWK